MNKTKPVPPDQIGHYIFVVASLEFDPKTRGSVIARTLAENNVWLAGDFTPFRSHYKVGDRVLLYVSGKGYRYFIGRCEIAAPIEEMEHREEVLAERLGLDGFFERIRLKNVELWNTPVPIKPLVLDLSFVKNKSNYGLNLRQAAARIPEADYNVVLAHVTS